MVTVPVVRGDEATWQPMDLVRDVLDVRVAAVSRGSLGPWVLVLSPLWQPLLAQRYSPPQRSITVVQRLLEIEGVLDVLISKTVPDWGIHLFQLAAKGEV